MSDIVQDFFSCTHIDLQVDLLEEPSVDPYACEWRRRMMHLYTSLLISCAMFGSVRAYLSDASNRRFAERQNNIQLNISKTDVHIEIVEKLNPELVFTEFTQGSGLAILCE